MVAQTKDRFVLGMMMKETIQAHDQAKKSYSVSTDPFKAIANFTVESLAIKDLQIEDTSLMRILPVVPASYTEKCIK